MNEGVLLRSHTDSCLAQSQMPFVRNAIVHLHNISGSPIQMLQRDSYTMHWACEHFFKRMIYFTFFIWTCLLNGVDLLNILGNSKNIRFPVRIYFMEEKLVNLCQKQKGKLTAQICHKKNEPKRNIPQWSDVLTVQVQYCSWLCLQQCIF